jgi:hypothetical protein
VSAGGRNAPCPCGSGVKYKRCPCGAYEATQFPRAKQRDREHEATLNRLALQTDNGRRRSAGVVALLAAGGLAAIR